MNDSVLTQEHENILQITLNRPDAYNALNLDMMTMLAETLSSAATDNSIKGVLLTGAGKAFCAGGDLKWISQQAEEASSVLHRLAPQFHLSIIEIRRMEKPVVAALNGIAAGGGFSLALACDFRVIGQTGKLRQAYTSSGLSIDGGGSFALPRLVGLARAMEIMAFDQPISAEQALEWGLVTKVVADDEVVSAAFAMLHDLARTALHSFAWSKKLMTHSFHNTLETQLEMERDGISDCAAHPNGQEGIRAFVEKRKPFFIKQLTVTNSNHTYSRFFTIPGEVIDENGHVNNVAYVQWMQDIAVEHYEAIGGTHPMRLAGATWVVREHKIEYFLPAFAGEEIEIKTWVENIRRVRSLRKYEFVRKSDGKLLVKGETDWVYVDVKTGRPLPIPDEVFKIFGFSQEKQV